MAAKLKRKSRIQNFIAKLIQQLGTKKLCPKRE